MGLEFQRVQQAFTAHIRNPQAVAIPDNIEPRRMKIYEDLFFNNIEGFAAGAFPVFKSLLTETDWLALIRAFLVDYRCSSPYFLEISQEFMQFLAAYSGALALPGFTQELTHYEWTELALDVADIEPDFTQINANGSLINEPVVVSPVAWPLAYCYPVHLIGPAFQPEQAPETPTYLVVYRNRDDDVQFMEINAVTARLLELLGLHTEATGNEVLQILGQEIGFTDQQALAQFGLELLQKLQADGLILGTKIS